ncbi:hypothetical protein EXIGLDRAFT_692355 [Exidia glandulosa HHB12029]|uniref:Uncharacterized protein n=1 Tax=Exidia glandulosa HHB12029 TaxID=1314781 RepID=A0A165I2A9_EXIGL|nr:hypothetical protein EXIGLDRAFT_692355 [Exidia glandulosa HHB12029]
MHPCAALSWAHGTFRQRETSQLVVQSATTKRRDSQEEPQHSASPHASDSDAPSIAHVSSYGRHKKASPARAPLITWVSSPDGNEHDAAAPKPHRIRAPPPKLQRRSGRRVPSRVPAEPAEDDEPGADVQDKHKKC